MTPHHHSLLSSCFLRLTEPKPTGRVSEWCEREIRFSEPDCSGPFNFTGREYMREPLDNFNRDDVTDQVMVWGTRLGKTRVLYGGTGWSIRHRSVRILYVKPKAKGTAGAADDARTRFLPMLRSSKCFSELLVEARRHDVTTGQQIIGSCIVDWTGSNSVSSLASNPCGIVIQDEVDKFNTTRKRDSDGNVVEADATSLADERTKDAQGVPKRFKASTPTIASGTIWVELMKSDLRRRFVPCPHCGKFMVLAWSEAFTMLPKVNQITGEPIPLAYVRWDQKAKNEKDEWDYKQVEETAHFECPHCSNSITDSHKFVMDKSAEWRATRHGLPAYRGFHLPSLYSTLPECAIGKMAVRFLKACRSLDGPRGFINSDLAEPYGGQDTIGKRIEEVTRIEVGEEWRKLQTIDCQQKSPHFWFVVRAYGERQIVGLKAGSVEMWDEVRGVQTENKIPDAGVIIDSGYGAKDDAEVYRTCAQYGELLEDKTKNRTIHIGWMPAKGMPGRRKWRNSEGLMVPWYYRAIDPYMGTNLAGDVSMDLFEFAADHFKDVLDRLRRNKDPRYHWTIDEAMNTDEYHEHMRGQVKRPVVKYAREVIEWVRRHRAAPDHLFACEVMQVAGAFSLGLLAMEKTNEEKKELQAA